MRIGKWDEEKVLFKDTGHDHSGGTAGARIGKISALTCIKAGATSFGDASGDINVDTGLTSVWYAWLNVKGATAAWVSATSGGTITCHPYATAGDFEWIAIGYA